MPSIITLLCVPASARIRTPVALTYPILVAEADILKQLLENKITIDKTIDIYLLNLLAIPRLNNNIFYGRLVYIIKLTFEIIICRFKKIRHIKVSSSK